jgi:putative glutamine amidotransferase
MRPRIAIPMPHSEAEYAGRALPQYVHAIEREGGEAVVIPLHQPNQAIARVATLCDAVLLPGSRADIDPEKYGAAERHPRTAAPDPARDNVDELLIQDAYNMRKPVFGICYGLQVLNVWRTGSLRQHIETEINHEAGRAVEKAHTVAVTANSLLRSILDDAEPQSRPLQLWVNSSHHQCAELPGDGLTVSARAEKDQVIEALEGTSADHFVLAVQWHPERTYDTDPASRALFRAFVEAARTRHRHPRTASPDFESLAR